MLTYFELSAKARGISNFEISKYNNMTHSSGLTLQGTKEILFLGEQRYIREYKVEELLL